HYLSLLFFLLPPRAAASTLVPYTTLFRSFARLRPRRTRRRCLPRTSPARTPTPGPRATGRSPAVARKCPPSSRSACWSRTSPGRSEEHTSELQSRENLVCRLLLEKKNKIH